MKSLYETYQEILNEAVLPSRLLYFINLDAIVQFEYYDPKNPELNGKREGIIGCLGYTPAGNLAVSIYQARGHTSSFIPMWKTFLVDKIKSIDLLRTKQVLQNSRTYQKARTQFNANGHKGFSKVEAVARFLR